MHVLAAAATALRPLLRRPVRTFLLLQGTIWGVAVAVFPSAVIEGTRHAVLTQGARLGADRVAIAADPTAAASATLDAADVTALRDALAAERVPVVAVGGLSVVALLGDGKGDGALVEADPAAPPARGLELAEGRWLREGDAADVCVVEADVGRRLAGRPLHPGDGVRLPSNRATGGAKVLRVVGVTRARDRAQRRTNDLGFDVDHPLYRSVARGLLHALGIPQVADDWKRSDAVVYVPRRSPGVEWIFLRVRPRQVKEAAQLASRTLVARGREPVTLHPLVLPIVTGRQIDRFDAVRVALFLACLSMGAVVMANLGLLSVLRRRREIAVRRVEGATRRTIAAHFLVEGLALGVVGGAAGCALGMALAALRVALSPVTGFAWIVPWHDAAIAVAVALGVGLLSALLPAVRASRQDPVVGLAEA